MRDNIIFFDGICAMCNNFVLFVLRKDKNKQVLFMSLQSQKAKDILFNYGVVYNSDNLNTIYYLKNNKIYYYSDVIIELFININYFKKAAKIGRLIPKFLRDNIYKLVSHNRYKLFGKIESCQLLSAQEKIRIIE